MGSPTETPTERAHDELNRMETAYNALVELDEAARGRAIQWLQRVLFSPKGVSHGK